MFAYPIVSILTIGNSLPSNSRWTVWIQWLNAWNPIAALNSIVNGGQVGVASFTLFRLHLAPWAAFTLVSLVATIILFILSMIFVKPNPSGRFISWFQRLDKQSTPA